MNLRRTAILALLCAVSVSAGAVEVFNLAARRNRVRAAARTKRQAMRERHE